MNDQFYDVIDPEGNTIETAEEQRAEAIEHKVEVAPVVHTPEQLRAMIRRWNKENVTVRLPRVLGAAGCGHRLDLSQHPRHSNCESCWFAWFNNHGEIVQQLDEMHTNNNDAMIVELQGVKFLHRWLQFMATVAQWKKQQEKNEQTSESSSSAGQPGDEDGLQIYDTTGDEEG